MNAQLKIKKENVFAALRLQKIVVSVGVGKLRAQQQFDEKALPEIMRELALITGQHPAARRARKSIASFKLREGEVVGLQVTLRHRRMQDFLARVIRIVLPRVKDFRGLAEQSVDEGGNLNIGLREQYVFPEVDIEKSKVHFGVQITCVPNVRDRRRAIDFYRSIGVPLKGFVRKSEPKGE